MRHHKHSLHHPTILSQLSRFRLERWHRFCVYGAFFFLALTGVVWLVAHYFLRTASEFGEAISPFEPWAMKLHGAAAMAALFFIGSLLNGHIRRAHRAQRNRYSGWSMVALLVLLTISGYALYYIASEFSRPVWSLTHWILGLLFPALLVLHIALGRRSTVLA